MNRFPKTEVNRSTFARLSETCKNPGVRGLDYDYIIAGAGAAGLSLLHHLAQAGLTGKRILIVDRERKGANDRTWCFWEAAPGPFEPIVFRRWQRMRVQDERTALDLDLTPYEYKLIRAEDFYAHMHQRISQWPAVTFLQGEASALQDRDGGASICINGETKHAQYVFNSIVSGDLPFAAWMKGADPPVQPRHNHLLQHFLGWVIETDAPEFADGVARLMDFRVPQHDETRFVYVLPFDRHRALVEFTVFGPKLLERAAYERELHAYIAAHVAHGSHAIVHTEFGAIPMTDARIPAPVGRYIINIGTAGGASKPSTGYTFARIQRQCEAIAQALAHGQPPATAQSPGFALLDRTLLNVLAKNRVAGRDVFMRLFARNPAARVLAFLDEATALPQTLALMRTVQLAPFTRALFDSI